MNWTGKGNKLHVSVHINSSHCSVAEGVYKVTFKRNMKEVVEIKITKFPIFSKYKLYGVDAHIDQVDVELGQITDFLDIKL